MTTEELLKPRYKVIANYPESPFAIDDILYADETCWTCDRIKWSHWLSPKLFPAIFKPLQWWEERNTEDMPEYVKRKDESEVFKRVFRYDGSGSIFVKQPKGKYGKGTASKIGLLNVLPATKEEYKSYINQQVKL